ncbi:unnamed protein product, partial [marine sediment metagenome]
MHLRPRLRKSLGVKITTNTFYIRATALAVKKYPLMVGKINGDKIKIAEDINVGFAVSASYGLVVPVIKNADQKSLPELAKLENQLTQKAHSRTLTFDDIQGETIALSNLGSFDIDSFIGIIPPPASTIISVGNPIEEVVVRKG